MDSLMKSFTHIFQDEMALPENGPSGSRVILMLTLPVIGLSYVAMKYWRGEKSWLEITRSEGIFPTPYSQEVKVVELPEERS